MRYLYYTQQEEKSYPVCLLSTVIRKDEIKSAYIDGHKLKEKDLLVISLHQAEGKKTTPVKEIKQYIEEELAPVLTDMGVEYVLCSDAAYFKVLCKVTKVDAYAGYAMDTEYGSWKVIYIPTYKQIFYNPEVVRAKIDQALTALVTHRAAMYVNPGENIIKFEAYPKTSGEIKAWLLKLLKMKKDLSCDIEAFSLKHYSAGIGTITFCWSEHEGIAFPVDYGTTPEESKIIRGYLREFFEAFTETITYHSIGFDVTVLTYQLYMQHILDTEGLLRGLDVLLKNWDCTKLITYLATNSTAGNKLSLKDQAQEFAGNYALTEINDITKIPLDILLRYNLIDGLSTIFVKKKHYQTMVNDQQLDIYKTIFKPAMWDIIQMQLTGLPLNMKRVKEVKTILEADESKAVTAMRASPLVQAFEIQMNKDWVDWKNSTLKKKRVTLNDANETFNPNSGPQIQKLLFEQLALPILSRTASGEPSTDGDTLKDLKQHTSDPEILTLLDAFLDYKAVNKILTSFIPAFENAAEGPDGWHYLFGNFNLGGTLSGRLSSSDPNLQNLPATASKYAKLIKSCFSAPPGWLFCGLDFDSLEDKISGLTTKDPNKLKVYTDGYDGHSLRAYAYFGDQMPDIDPTSVISINSIQTKYKDLRQESKVPTFALTYQGTYITLMVKAGFDEAKAKKVEKAYAELYSVSIKWVNDRIAKAAEDGYITAAFGLRVRTPLLKQVVLGNRATPYEATAEGRSAGNALGQSWCLLNTRAGIEFNQKVRASIHRLDIRPCAQIHDAQYFLIRDEIRAVEFANEHLPNAVRWQDHPDIIHPEVKLSGEMFICYPDWSKEINLPNYIKGQDILNVIDKALK